MPTKKLLGAAALMAALAGGGVAGALLGAPTTSSAQEDPTTTTVEEDAATTADEGSSASDETEKDCPRGPGFRHPIRGEALDAASDALGLTNQELRTALQEDGATIATVAEAEGVELQTVIDAMVAAATERINQAVANGRLDQAEADELIAELPERMAELVQKDLPDHPRGPRGPRVVVDDGGS
jgi:hypothetical protein